MSPALVQPTFTEKSGSPLTTYVDDSKTPTPSPATNSDIDDDGDDDDNDDGKTTEEERKFVRRLDLLLISYIWISYCMKQIDASNYKTAYVSGMRESLHLYGNELNYLDVSYRIGYALFLLPSSYLLSKVRPSLYLPFLELLWGICTALMALAKPGHPWLLYALRFLIGVFEASAYPGYTTLLMAWYKPREIAPRLGLFGTSYPAASAFTGVLQAALHTGLNGRGGLEGWRWLFVVNGVMTVVVALSGFVVLPDPGRRAWWMPKHARPLAVMSTKENWFRTAARTIKSPTFWTVCAGYCMWTWAQNANSWFTVYLSTVTSPALSIAQINTIPLGAYFLSAACLIGFPVLSSNFPHYTTALISAPLLVHSAACIALSQWPSTFWGQMLAWHFLFVSSASGALLLSRMAAKWKDDADRRRVAVAIIVMVVYAFDAGTTTVFWPAKEAPRYRVGWGVAASFAAGSSVVAGTWWWRGQRRRGGAGCGGM